MTSAPEETVAVLGDTVPRRHEPNRDHPQGKQTQTQHGSSLAATLFWLKEAAQRGTNINNNSRIKEI